MFYIYFLVYKWSELQFLCDKQQGDQTSRRSNQSTLKEINSECLSEGLILKLSSSTLATWCQKPTHWKWPWEILRAGGEGDNRGCDDWMASSTNWTWVWANSGRLWRIGRCSVVQSMGSQKITLNWATEQPQQWWSDTDKCIHENANTILSIFGNKQN